MKKKLVSILLWLMFVPSFIYAVLIFIPIIINANEGPGLFGTIIILFILGLPVIFFPAILIGSIIFFRQHKEHFYSSGFDSFILIIMFTLVILDIFRIFPLHSILIDFLDVHSLLKYYL